tara:strand:+ start:327 stop:974 length:648 start_codon:yes stop_codon:yes gene_type:complete
MYPTLIVDDFFENPDAIVDYANSLDYYPTTGEYPGERSKCLSKLDGDLYQTICSDILDSFYPNKKYMFVCEIQFQRIKPFHEDKYHPRNRGWIHRDSQVHFGGIIYLDKNPEPDTGTSIYENVGIIGKSDECMEIKKDFYTGKSVPDDLYEAAFNYTNKDLEETITVKNKYNRLFCFNSKQHHAAQTYGSGENVRLTLSFFFRDIASPFNPPLYR